MILNLPLGAMMKRSAFAFAMILFLTQTFLAISHYTMFWGTGPEIYGSFFNISLAVDHLSFIVLVSIGIVVLASLVVAKCSIEDENEMFNFTNLLIIASIGMYGITMVKDIFSLYIFLEITAVSAFILIALKKDKLALEGAFKYIILSAIATVMMLSAIALLLLLSGGTSFAAVKAGLAQSQTGFLTRIAIAVFLGGLFIKGGIVPFHGWLPDAYSTAPSSVSVLLAGIITKVSGIYTVIRIVTSLFGFGFGISHILMFVGTFSILVGAFAALGQSDFKRMLAYSSISQVGYIILGFGTGTPLGVMGAVFHLFNHAIFKSLLFVNSAAVEKEAGTIDMDKLGGLSARMPVTGATSVIGFLSTSGIPPLAGFWSKLLIVIALWQSGNYAYAAIAVLASVLTLAYLLSMQRRVFFGKLAIGLENIKEANGKCIAVAVALAIITIGAGVFFPVIYYNFLEPLKSLLVQ
jgi:multicomponent Na+:H+ antiporter subunit D